MAPALSLVMPCHNRRDALRQTLESLAHQTLPPDRFEVILVDQASTDGGPEVARRMDTSFLLRVVAQDALYGISVARNAGVGAAKAPLVLLLDADLLPEPGLLEAHLACHAGSAGALVCGRVLPYPPAYRTFVERAANPDTGLDRGDSPRRLRFFDALGGHLSMALETYSRIGPFDPCLRGFEDIDFAYRAERLGVPILYCPSARCSHNHPRTLAERMSQARAYSRMIPRLLAAYPELRGQVAPLRAFEAIQWRSERRALLRSKLRARAYACVPARGALWLVLQVLERLEVLPRLAKAAYWRLLLAHRTLGFREGLRL